MSKLKLVRSKNNSFVVDTEADKKFGDKVFVPDYPDSEWTYMEPPCPLPYWGNPNACFKIIYSLHKIDDSIPLFEMVEDDIKPIQGLISELKEMLNECLPEFKIGIQHSILRASAYLRKRYEDGKNTKQQVENLFGGHTRYGKTAVDILIEKGLIEVYRGNGSENPTDSVYPILTRKGQKLVDAIIGVSNLTIL